MSPALFLESLKHLSSWQVFWLTPSLSVLPNSVERGELREESVFYSQFSIFNSQLNQWIEHCSKTLVELTVAGLFRIYTWFPFQCFFRNEKNTTKISGTKVMLFYDLYLLVVNIYLAPLFFMIWVVETFCESIFYLQCKFHCHSKQAELQTCAWNNEIFYELLVITGLHFSIHL